MKQINLSYVSNHDCYADTDTAPADCSRAVQRSLFTAASTTGESYLQSDQVMPDLIAISHQHAPGSSFVNLSDKPKPSPVPESSRPLLCDVPSAVQAVAQTYQSQSADISVLVKHLLASMAVSVDDDVCTLQKLTMSQSQCSIWQKHRAGVSLRYPESKKNVTYYVFWLCFIHFRELVRPFVHASVRASQNIVDIS